MRRLIRLQYRLILILVVGFTTIAFACSSEPQKATVPAHLEEIENLTIFAEGTFPHLEINFERDISIGDSPEQPIGGLGGFAVDDEGRIYISDYQQQTLLVFEPNGEYLTSVAEVAMAPGNILAVPFPR